MRQKYGNQKTIIDGIVFDSKREANRYAELKLLERADEICELEMQKEFELIPNQYRDGKLIERACKYRADFFYLDKRKGKYICEDVKGFKTDVYKIKKKLMLYRHGIEVREI